MDIISLPSGNNINVYTPAELKNHLDKFVIGQEKAKRTLCTAVYNHYKRAYALKVCHKDIPAVKSNVILSGPTGSGKTYMVKLLAEYMGVPYFIADATTVTQAGFVGDDVETLLTGLLRAANYNVMDAECGIVFIDEIDKLAKRASGPNLSGKDPVGEGVQQALLKIVEGNTVGVTRFGGRKHPDEELIYMDTSQILFIGSGSFAGVESIIEERLSGGTGSVNLDPNEDIMDYLCPEDIRKFGFIPEFIGRFPIITNVGSLKKEDFVKILKDPTDNILSHYASLLRLNGIEFVITIDAIEYIAEVAVSLKTGVRSLKSLLECILEDFMFDAPTMNANKIYVDKTVAQNKLDKRYKNIGGFQK